MTEREVINDMLDTTRKYLRDRKLILSKKKTKRNSRSRAVQILRVYF